MPGGCGFADKLHEAVIDKCGVHKSIIELGCGNGGNLSRFKGWERVGIDPSAVNIHHARKRRIKARFVQENHHYLAGYEDKNFDVGMTLSVLNHIGYIKTAFINIVRICKDLVLVEPYRKGQDRQAERGEIKLWDVTWFHDYEKLIQSCGDKIKFYSIEPFPLYETNCGPLYHLIHIIT